MARILIIDDDEAVAIALQHVLTTEGNRVEIASGGYLITAPDHEPVVWTQAERAKGQAWGMKTVPTFHIRGTPPVPEEEELLAAHAARV